MMVYKSSLDYFFSTIETFSESIDKSTLNYNHSELLDILIERDCFKFLKIGDEQQYQSIQKFGQEYHEIVDAIMKAEDISENSKQFLNRISIIDQKTKDELPAALSFYTRLWGTPVEALYYYKVRDFNKALDKTLECISGIDTLIEEGLTTLMFRNITQNRNISKILLRQGKFKEGISIQTNIIKYLLTGLNDGLFGACFDNNSVWKKSDKYVKEAYAYQYFIDNVLFFIKPVPEILSENRIWLYESLFGNLSIRKINTPERLVMYNWLSLKKLFAKGRYNKFLKELALYLSEPISQMFDPLKISLLQDVKVILNTSSNGNDIYLTNKIIDFLKIKIKSYKDVNSFIIAQMTNYPSPIDHKITGPSKILLYTQ